MSVITTFSAPQAIAAYTPASPQPQPRSSTRCPGARSAQESIASVPRSARVGEKSPAAVSNSIVKPPKATVSAMRIAPLRPL